MKQSRFTDEQIIGFLKQADAGMSVKKKQLVWRLISHCQRSGV